MKKHRALMSLVLALALLGVGCVQATPAAVQAPAEQVATETQAPAEAAAQAEGIPNLVQAGVLTVADTGKAPPATMMNESGEPVGAWIDLANRWAEDLGLELEIVYLDWPGVLPGLQAGKFDLAGSGVRLTPERIASPDFIMSDPFVAEGVMLMVKKDSGIESWDDMAGKTLGIIRGEHEGDVAVEQIGDVVADVVELPGKQEGLLEVLSGRVDGFAAGSSGMAYQLKTAPQGDELKLVGPAADVRPGGTAVRVETPELALEINRLINQYLRDGTLDQIYTEWFGESNPVTTLRESWSPQ